MIVVAVIVFLILVLLYFLAINAPEGWQDSAGFHFGQFPNGGGESHRNENTAKAQSAGQPVAGCRIVKKEYPVRQGKLAADAVGQCVPPASVIILIAGARVPAIVLLAQSPAGCVGSNPTPATNFKS